MNVEESVWKGLCSVTSFGLDRVLKVRVIVALCIEVLMVGD
jgi:hypothetical protein